jgi:hypothetical protein
MEPIKREPRFAKLACMSYMIRLAIVGILAGMVSVAPALAGTVSFSISLSATASVVENSSGVSLVLPNAVGTIPPFGPCQISPGL